MVASPNNSLEMDQGEFTARFCSRPQNYAWFLGAGASATAGLPTATNVLWDMKRRYYCQQENQDISREDLQSESVRSKIQSFMESKGFPELWADDEYTVCFEKIFGEDKERQRRYLHGILAEDKATLSVGNRVLGALMAAGYARMTFTTNFDPVVEKAFAEVSGKSLAAFHLEGSRAANQALNNEEFPIYCKLHGDFRYDSLKNLADDLAAQNRELSECFTNAASRFGVVVAGYSGRDRSVVDLFHRVLQNPNPFPHGLFWMVLKGSSPLPTVTELIEQTRKKGVAAHLVPIETFDAMLLRLWRNIADKPQYLDQQVRKVKIATVDIPLPQPGHGKPLVRLNALPVVSWPIRCLELSFRKPKNWDDLAKARTASNGQIVVTKGPSILCWGDKEIIRQSFGADLLSITERDLPQELAAPHNLYVKGFVEEMLCKALARGKALRARVSRQAVFLLVENAPCNQDELKSLSALVRPLSGEVPNVMTPVTDDHPVAEKVTWAEAARITIDFKNGKLWLLIEPDVWIEPARARRYAVDFLDKRRGGRFNKEFNALLDAWVHIILGTPERNAEIEVRGFNAGNGAENPAFKISSRTAFTKRHPG
jgi:hypothetical protein